MLIFLDDNPVLAAGSLATADITNALKDAIRAQTQAYYMMGGAPEEALEYEDLNPESKIYQLAAWAITSRQNYHWLNNFVHNLLNRYRARKESQPKPEFVAANAILKKAIPQNLINNGLYPRPILVDPRPFPPNLDGLRAYYLARISARKDDLVKLYSGDVLPYWHAKPVVKNLIAAQKKQRKSKKENEQQVSSSDN